MIQGDSGCTIPRKGEGFSSQSGTDQTPKKNTAPSATGGENYTSGEPITNTHSYQVDEL